MQTKLISLGFILILVIYNCKRDDNSSTDLPFQATVLGLNPDCSGYEIKITNGLDNVNAILGETSNDSICIAVNLPDSLKVVGLSIQLDYIRPNNKELGVCTTLGLSHNWIFITKALSSTCFDNTLYQKHKNDFCPDNCPGVTGCDGRTYCNECYAERQGIRIKK